MNLEKLKTFLGKQIFVLYEDSGTICRAKGILKDVEPNSIHLETADNLLIISGSQILKIKIPKRYEKWKQ